MVLVPLVALLGACSRGDTPSAAVNSSGATPAPGTAADALDKMDKRKPVPLLPMMANHQKQNMRDHLVAIQEISTSLASDDFSGIERAAGRIGFSEQMGQMCTHMGAGAAGFTEQALHFHRTADRITEAPRARDKGRVIKELGATLQTCTSCHEQWKQQVVDEPTWTRLTASAPLTHGGH
jgi:hypothetical protein